MKTLLVPEYHKLKYTKKVRYLIFNESTREPDQPNLLWLRYAYGVGEWCRECIGGTIVVELSDRSLPDYTHKDVQLGLDPGWAIECKVIILNRVCIKCYILLFVVYRFPFLLQPCSNSLLLHTTFSSIKTDPLECYCCRLLKRLYTD